MFVMLVALAVMGCATQSPLSSAIDARSPSPSTTAASPSPTTRTASVTRLLDEIVVATSTPPTGTEFFQSMNGVQSGTQMVQDSSSAVQSAVLQGFVDGLTREFASPETAAVIRGSASPNDLDPADHHFVGSLALAYKDASSAQAALDVFLDALRPTYKTEEDLEFGARGALFRGEFLGVHSLLYIWRDGRFVMGILANGMGEDEIRDLAAGMQARMPDAPDD